VTTSENPDKFSIYEVFSCFLFFESSLWSHSLAVRSITALLMVHAASEMGRRAVVTDK
jgi:hypothetical protein